MIGKGLVSMPMVFEISEFINDVNKSLYYDIINDINGQYYSDTSLNDETIYSYIIKEYSNIIGLNKMNMMSLALSLNYYTPKLVIYRQLLEQKINMYSNDDDCSITDQYVYVESKDTHKLTKLKDGNIDAILNDIKGITVDVDDGYDGFELYPKIEHMMGNCEEFGLLIVYYGDFRTKIFKDVHSKLSDIIGDNICYLFRPISSTVDAKSFNLQVCWFNCF